MGRIGLFGGTFDPVHLGHIALARQVLDTFSLDRLLWIPAGNPPHKTEQSITDKLHRMNMVTLATEDEPRFTVSDFEIKRNEPNYSYITISHFKKEFPNDEVFFVVGGDSFRDFPLWKNYKTLISLCTFIVVPREDVSPEQYNAMYKKKDGLPKVLFLEGFSYPASSTQIRQRIKNNESTDGLLPTNVLQYIKTNNLYT